MELVGSAKIPAHAWFQSAIHSHITPAANLF